MACIICFGSYLVDAPLVNRAALPNDFYAGNTGSSMDRMKCQSSFGLIALL